ncbi:type VI secretion system baseplate subunit TssE [Vibrio sp. SCSIO 43136]|uniref:type VI secretion system baseplate subunit TssE n=1 Tax=Vibrio sp. SCSIO 43136 TaxID=2819101 RepID=UPI002075E4E6|nr:type VI secretion system baseplate subunit TssE [Vibrio sp. SCSIO 43136]USD66345.1 type VI secretion system baseplate subunit TssE [Vibrio sp. SCSIO 43136]
MSFWSTFLDKSDSNDSLLESVRYQLTALLNSEAPMRKVSHQFPNVEASILGFGLDCAHSVSSQVDHDQFARSMESWVKRYEPRLSEVSVFVEESDPNKNLLCFSLMAKMSTEKGDHVFLFDSNISITRQTAKLEGQEVV